MLEKIRTRARRRQHAFRVKRNRRFDQGENLATEPRRWGRHCAAPAACSCWMCGNPRRHLGLRTIQEQRFLQEPLQPEDLSV